MKIKRLKYENFTVFENQVFDFSSGINVIIGENGTGKTHVLKTLYSACQAVDAKTMFSQKLVMTMMPDDYKISRLIHRKQGNQTALIRVVADEDNKERILSTSFSIKTKKWEAEETGKDGWEQTFSGTSSIFIPAKEILSNSYKLNAAVEKNNVHFDDTYLDIINAAKVDISVGRNTAARDAILEKIEKMTQGKVYYDSDKDEFYLKKGQSKQEFNLVAEGIRKMALLWQLVKNGTLEKGSILFWDEPEANINPSFVDIIVELLLILQRKGVQIFISTHDYVLASYFNVRMQTEDNVLFHSFSRQGDSIGYEYNPCFSKLDENPISAAYLQLLDEIYNI